MEPLRLVAGPLTMIFEPESGFLRYVSCGGKEIVRGVYAAVRDENWGTSPHVLEEITHETTDKGFLVKWRLREGDKLVWEGTLSGWPEGSVDYEVRGKALRNYRGRRTGLCLLSPPSMSGLPVVVHHADDSIESSMFPESVSPHQPFYSVAGLEGPVDEKTQWRAGFRGEVFETEDQRNWSDASFKTYCRPQEWPQPFEVKEGEEIVHGVRIFLLPPMSESPCPPAEEGDYKWERTGTVPLVGTMANVDEPLSSQDAETLKSLNLAFVGVEVDDRNRMKSGLEVAAQIGAPVRLFLRGDWPAHASELLGETKPNSIVLTDIGVCDGSPDRLREIRETLRGVPIIISSPDNFTELNRHRPGCSGYDGLGFAVNPQVHTFDDRSILETGESHWRLVKDTVKIGGGKPAHVGPVTFGGGDDARLHDRVGAAYTASAVMHQSEAGAASVALYRSHGKRGILGAGLVETIKGLAALQGQPIEIARSARPLERQAFRIGDRLVEIDTEKGGVKGFAD
ncbi:hypothetical protein EON81_07485 [bacterium]|nr:MAG: hypothetical protein EON81_07485 [bacterium]